MNIPETVKIEKNHYFYQLLLYFLAFGSKARIITPEYLGKSIYKSYKGYTDNYEKNETYIF